MLFITFKVYPSGLLLSSLDVIFRIGCNLLRPPLCGMFVYKFRAPFSFYIIKLYVPSLFSHFRRIKTTNHKLLKISFKGPKKKLIKVIIMYNF